MKWLLVLLAACSPTLSAGYDARTRISGPVGTMVTQPAATARDDGTAAPPVDDTASYSFAVGAAFGKRMALELGTHLHDVNTASFSLPSASGVDPRSPRYLLTTSSIDVKFRWLALRHVTSDLHMGPSVGNLIDRGMGAWDFGNGYRYGVTLGAKLGPVGAFADVYQMKMAFDDGAAKGVSTLSGVTFGLSLR